MSRREPGVLLRDMLDHAREALDAARGRSRRDLDHDRMLQVFLIHMLQVIGKAASRMPTDFTQRRPQIPWSAMIGARNVIVHGYAQVDLDIVWRTLTEELPRSTGMVEQLSAQPG